MTAPTRRRRLLANATLLAVSIAVSLALVEAGVRLYLWLAPASAIFALSHSDAQRQTVWHKLHTLDHAQGGEGLTAFEAAAHDPLLGWVPKPNLDDYVHPALTGGRAPVSTNSVGMRGRREFAPQKPPGVHRIVVVGDSFTFGLQVGDDDTWPERLHVELQQTRTTSWEVLNLGVYGYGLDQQYLMLRDRGMRWQPDVVVFAAYVDGVMRSGMTFRDYAKPRFILDGERLRLTGVPVPSPGELLARAAPPVGTRSYALDLVRDRVRNVTSTEASAPDLERLSHAIVRAAVETSRAGDARFLLVVIPMLHIGERSVALEHRFEAWAAELGVPVVNVRAPLDAAAARTGRPMWAGHFTAEGNAEVARAVAAALGRLVPDASAPPAPATP